MLREKGHEPMASFLREWVKEPTFCGMPYKR